MFARKLDLPPSRDLPWPLRPLASAETGLEYDRFGRMVMSIRHGVLKGISPPMLAWWFGNIAGQVVVGEVSFDRYLAWHPYDHIRWELAKPAVGGGVGVGARFRIVEAFGRNPDYHVDVIETVARLDETGIELVGDVLGFEVSRLRHDFVSVAGGTQYISRLTIGSDLALLGPFANRMIRRMVFSEAMGMAWLRHNVEEVGQLEYLLPLLYPRDGIEGSDPRDAVRERGVSK